MTNVRFPGRNGRRRLPARRQHDEIGAKVLPFRPHDAPPALPRPRQPEDDSPPAADEDRVIVGELVDPDDDPNARRVAPWRAVVERAPVLPRWLTDRDEAKLAAEWLAGYVAHAIAFHAVRVPKYLLVLIGRSPRGLVRLLRACHMWAGDTEIRPLLAAAVVHGDSHDYQRLASLHLGRTRPRLALLVLTGLLVGFVGFAAWTSSPAAGWLFTASMLVGLGALGREQDKPLTGRSTVTHKAPKLTSDAVVRALGALGIAEINKAIKDGPGISFPAPIQRDGAGWRAEVDLPYGVTASDIMDRREKVASGLRRPLGCVWPESDGDSHAGRLILWVGDRDFGKTKPTAWPRAKSGTVDLFKSFEYGRDQRGRVVTMLLMFASVLIGAMPRMGKTFAMRIILLAAALDKTAELRVFELKGTGDLSMLGQVAHRYASGADDVAIEACMDSLREVYNLLDTRAAQIRKLPRDVCPENKVTPELAAKRSLGLWPIVLGIDECQELFSHPTYGGEAERLCLAIVKRGPALGIMLVLATQRPDSNSLPTGISSNVGIRFCLRVMGQVENDMVLGTSSYKNGIRATSFTASDKGIGWLIGAADDPQIARPDYTDAPAAEAIAARARRIRERAGTLTGYAIGEDSDEQQAAVSLLADVDAVLGPGEDKAWSETIIARLCELRPDVYAGWTPHQLSLALQPYGVTTRQVWSQDAAGLKANRRGVHRADVVKARKTREDSDAS